MGELSRRGLSFETWYYERKVGLLEKKSYEAIEQNEHMALRDLKRECGIAKETSGKFDRTRINFQKNLIIAMRGRKQKVSGEGKSYGWNSTVFTTMEYLREKI